MNKIQFSLVMPSIRPQLWLRFCNCLKNTMLNWEVIAVGDVAPSEDVMKNLPSNFRWINSSVKPSQATHIAFMEAQGEIVSLTADDALYFAPPKFPIISAGGKVIGEWTGNPLDNMYFFMKNFDKIYPRFRRNYRKIAYGFRMFEDQFAVETTTTHHLTNDENFTPYQKLILYPFFAIYRDVYFEMGGYDNRFVCGQAENDFLLRIAAKNGYTEQSICPTAMVLAIHDEHKNEGKFREYHAFENSILKKLWIRPDMPDWFGRLDWLHPYDNNETLYTISQGNKGESGDWM